MLAVGCGRLMAVADSLFGFHHKPDEFLAAVKWFGHTSWFSLCMHCVLAVPMDSLEHHPLIITPPPPIPMPGYDLYGWEKGLHVMWLSQ